MLGASRRISRVCAATFIRSVHVEAKIKAMGLQLPSAPGAPKGNYTNFIRNGNMVYFAGHLPIPPDGGDMVKGTLGTNVSVEQGQQAARYCCQQLLASMTAATGGNLDKIKKVVKIVGFVNSANDFTAQPSVVNGCSDLMGEVFGVEVGRHARSAVGVNVLPLGAAVEIECICEIVD